MVEEIVLADINAALDRLATGHSMGAVPVS
jgi:hypothetical protein